MPSRDMKVTRFARRAALVSIHREAKRRMPAPQAIDRAFGLLLMCFK